MDRRDFVKKIGVGSVIACVSVSGLNSCRILSGAAKTPEIPPEALAFSNGKIIIQLGKVPELKKAGAAYKLVTPSERKLIIVHSNDEWAPYKVLENNCSHGINELELADDILRCPGCGHSQFDLEGQVLKGPAKAKIQSFPVNIDGDKITIDLSQQVI